MHVHGHRITIDIPGRRLTMEVPDDELRRRHRLRASTSGPGFGFRPAQRDRPVSTALQLYAAATTSANRGAVRDLCQL